MAFFLARMRTLSNGSDKLIDLSSLAILPQDLDSSRVKVQIGIIGQEHVVDFVKSFCPELVEWDLNFLKNAATSDSVPTWGSIGLGKYTDGNIRKAIENKFGKEVSGKIQFISLKSNVTTIFWMDPYSAVKITNTYFPVVSDQGKQHLVHYTLSKECKQARFHS